MHNNHRGTSAAGVWLCLPSRAACGSLSQHISGESWGTRAFWASRTGCRMLDCSHNHIPSLYPLCSICLLYHSTSLLLPRLFLPLCGKINCASVKTRSSSSSLPCMFPHPQDTNPISWIAQPPELQQNKSRHSLGCCGATQHFAVSGQGWLRVCKQSYCTPTLPPSRLSWHAVLRTANCSPN